MLTPEIVYTAGTNGHSPNPPPANFLKSNNGGWNWSIVSDLPSWTYDILFLDSMTGFASGDHGKISKTANGGINWILSQLDNRLMLRCLFFINNYTGWVTGNIPKVGGVIFKTTDAGSHWFLVSGEILPPMDKNKIIRCYPNPFNTKTKIKFFVPIQNDVIIDIYDITGKFVLNLLNKTQCWPRYYEIEFDGTNLASGIYFCQIRGYAPYSEFLQGKDSYKIVLIK
jgi:photosystem II stability/assembly factor-like uncharacterized protein